jgi:hypothetical protein
MKKEDSRRNTGKEEGAGLDLGYDVHAQGRDGHPASGSAARRRAPQEAGVCVRTSSASVRLS